MIVHKIMIYSILFLAVQTEDLAGVMRGIRDIDQKHIFQIKEK